MSTGFDILFSPGPVFPSEPINVYLEILKLVLSASGVRRPQVKLTVYRRQRPFDYGIGSKDPRIVFDDSVHEDRAFEEITKLIDDDAPEDPGLYIGVRVRTTSCEGCYQADRAVGVFL